MTADEPSLRQILMWILAELQRQADERPVLLTRQQAADWAQVSLGKLDEWSELPGFPVVRTDHFVRIHAAALEEWLAEYAASSNQPTPMKRRRGA